MALDRHGAPSLRPCFLFFLSPRRAAAGAAVVTAAASDAYRARRSERSSPVQRRRRSAISNGEQQQARGPLSSAHCCSLIADGNPEKGDRARGRSAIARAATARVPSRKRPRPRDGGGDTRHSPATPSQRGLTAVDECRPLSPLVIRPSAFSGARLSYRLPFSGILLTTATVPLRPTAARLA